MCVYVGVCMYPCVCVCKYCVRVEVCVCVCLALFIYLHVDQPSPGVRGDQQNVSEGWAKPSSLQRATLSEHQHESELAGLSSNWGE